MIRPEFPAVVSWSTFVNGEYVTPKGKREYTDLYNPADNEHKIATVPMSDQGDLDEAINAARQAYDHGPWPIMSVKERAKILYKFADLILKKAKFFGTIEAYNVGKLYQECVEHEAPRAAENIKFFAQAIEQWQNESFYGSANFLGKTVTTLSITSRASVGVCALIVPWNSPLMLATWKIGPCLAAGNTCVVKPSPWASLSILQLGELANEAGIPPGVINIINGGKNIGESLVWSSKVDRVSFTGSADTGKNIQTANAGVRLAPVSLELGGKAANLVFADADLDLALKGVLRSAFRSQGQSCVAGSRLLVQDIIYEDFLRSLTEQAKNLKIGDQFDQSTEIGPLINETHLKRIEDFIRYGVVEGARLLCGGKRPENKKLASGNYLEPTIFDRVTAKMKIWRDEIFGPVLSVVKFGSQEEALRLANQTYFGLSANVWTTNLNRALFVADHLETGMVWINGHFIRDLRAPFGGWKESGVGFEGGHYSLEFFSKPKMVCVAY